MKPITIGLTLVLLLGGAASAQNYLNGPESVAFDTLRNQYLVSSLLNNKIVSIDINGVQTEWLNLTVAPFGNCILGDTLYFTSGRRVYGYSIDTKAEVMNITGEFFNALDGITADSSGHLYVVSTSSGRIFKINLADRTSSLFISGLTPNVQDVFFDDAHNRLLIATFASNHAIQAVDLPDSTVYNLISPGPGFNDGVGTDNYGNLYVGSYNAGTIVMWDSNYTNPGVIISDGHIGPSGIDYNRRDDILAIPNFDADTVKFLRCNYSQLGLVGFQLNESSGDNDGHAEPGETVEILPTIRNDKWPGKDVFATVTTADPFISISTDMILFGDCAGWGTEKVAPLPFEFTVDPSCPDPYIIQFELLLEDSAGERTIDTIFVYAGNQPGLFEDVENSAPFWTHEPFTEEYLDEWHISDFRKWAGANSWHIGGQDGADYAPLNDAALITPPLLLPNKAKMTFWHWIETPDGSSAEDASDGGIVMLGTQNGSWTQITPLGGYHYTTVNAPGSPFEVGTECYAGSSGWRLATFDLSAYSGVVQIMFRFGTDAGNNFEGWYIDDVLIEYGGCCIDPAGDINGNGNLDVVDLTFFVDFLFAGGSAPPCPEEADLDADHQTNIADLTYLVDYLFGGGPLPLNCL